MYQNIIETKKNCILKMNKNLADFNTALETY